MQIHGFVMYRALNGTKNDNELCFELRADEETYKQYPFQFVYRIKYRLEENRVCITYEEENHDTKKICATVSDMTCLMMMRLFWEIQVLASN